ncbi:MAG: esterase family protein [Bacteroidales bacterium]|nr:esterase family protein [Bacteroidales bacterium]
MRKLLPIVAILLLSSSCGIVRMRSSEAYLPGPAIRADYTPRGIVEEHYHPCSVKGPTQRHLIAYLPADYYESTQRYPVLYLLHGARGYETSWIRKGKVYQTCDSLWREGKAAPCIVIMPNVNSYIDDYDYEGGRFKDAFESIFEVDGYVESAFMRDVVHFVDSVYRTVPDGAHRAVAGLSIGGYQSIQFAANFPQEFGYVGAMSPYMWALGHPSITRFKFYGGLESKMKKQFESAPPEGFYLYAGKLDMMRPATLKLHHRMTINGYAHEYTRYPGSHDWNNGWIQELEDFMQKIFKEN